MDEIGSILVVIRTTKYCQKAVDNGLLLAKKLGAKLYILHSIYNPFGLKGWNLPLPFSPQLEKEYKKMQAEARESLDNMISKEKAAGMPIELIMCDADPTCVDETCKSGVCKGDSTKDVYSIVKEKNIDLIILRSHQESRLEHFLFGRSNEDIIQKMPCSVLLIKDEPKPAPF